MNSFSPLTQAILDMATEGQLSAIFRVVQPTEGSIPCMCALPSPESAPPHCLQRVNPGDRVAFFKGDYTDWSDEDRKVFTDEHPECLHCEAHMLAREISEAFERLRPTPLGDLAGVQEGYVDPIEQLGKSDNGDDHSFAGVFGYIWATEQAAEAFDLPRDPATVEEHAESVSDLSPYKVAVFDWVQKRRNNVKGMAEAIPTDHALEVAVERDQAAMLLRACEGHRVPNVALHFLREAAGLPSHAEDQKMKHLLWLKGWMAHMSQPGSKVVFRRNGEETPQPYPEKGRKQAIANMARVEQEIEKRNAELNRT